MFPVCICPCSVARSGSEYEKPNQFFLVPRVSWESEICLACLSNTAARTLLPSQVCPGTWVLSVTQEAQRLPKRQLPHSRVLGWAGLSEFAGKRGSPPPRWSWCTRHLGPCWWGTVPLPRLLAVLADPKAQLLESCFFLPLLHKVKPCFCWPTAHSVISVWFQKYTCG